MPGVRSATYLCASIYIDTYIHLLHFMEKKSQIFTDLLNKNYLFVLLVFFID